MNTAEARDHLQALVSLGFTAIEAEVYAFLLQEAPATGYRVAQATGRSIGHVYKAIESLEDKGALLVDNHENRQCRAVPIDDLLNQLDRQFKASRAAAARALKTLDKQPADGRVYQLQTRDQVIERCRSMLRECRQFMIGSICPEPFEELRDDLASVASRGRDVGIKTFQPATIAGVEIVVDIRESAALEQGIGQWLNLIVDGSSTLLALFHESDGSVHQAFYTASPYLSWVMFTGSSSDFILAAIRRRLREDASAAEIKSLIDGFNRFEIPTSLGKQTLMKQFRQRGRRGRIASAGQDTGA